jgi:hypothetical protein
MCGFSLVDLENSPLPHTHALSLEFYVALNRADLWCPGIFAPPAVYKQVQHLLDFKKRTI